MAKVLLIGMLKGIFPVTIRQKQSLPLLVRFLREPQQSAAGAVPFAEVLFVRKFMHGVKVASTEVVHAVLIWP